MDLGNFDLWTMLTGFVAGNKVLSFALAVIGYLFFKKPKPTLPVTTTVTADGTTITQSAPVQEVNELLSVTDLQSVLRLLGQTTKTNEPIELLFKVGGREWRVSSTVVPKVQG